MSIDAETVATYVKQNLDINSIIIGDDSETSIFQSLTLCY